MKAPSLTSFGWPRALWPLALAATVVWCSSHPLPRWGEPVHQSDKVVHFLVFGLIASLVARLAAVQRTRPLGIYTAVLIVSVFGVTDELHQHFTPGRSMDVLDWLADTLGATAATVLYARWRWYRELLETSVSSLFGKRRVEIAGAACLIAEDGFSRSPEEDRGAPFPDRAA